MHSCPHFYMVSYFHFSPLVQSRWRYFLNVYIYILWRLCFFIWIVARRDNNHVDLKHQSLTMTLVLKRSEVKNKATALNWKCQPFLLKGTQETSFGGSYLSVVKLHFKSAIFKNNQSVNEKLNSTGDAYILVIGPQPHVAYYCEIATNQQLCLFVYPTSLGMVSISFEWSNALLFWVGTNICVNTISICAEDIVIVTINFSLS